MRVDFSQFLMCVRMLDKERKAGKETKEGIGKIKPP